MKTYHLALLTLVLGVAAQTANATPPRSIYCNAHDALGKITSIIAYSAKAGIVSASVDFNDGSASTSMSGNGDLDSVIQISPSQESGKGLIRYAIKKIDGQYRVVEQSFCSPSTEKETCNEARSQEVRAETIVEEVTCSPQA